MSDVSNTKPNGFHGDDGLDRVRTAGAISITPEMFEQLYLGPKNQVSGKLRATFGNPAPIGLAGFILSTTPLSMVLLGWQGAGGISGVANVASYIFLGGLLMVLGGVGEWILGNTFPALVFLVFGGYWLSLGGTLIPGYGAYATYSTTGNPAEGLEEPEFFATFAFFLVAMAMVCFVLAVAGLRTNVVLLGILTLLVPTFATLAASFFAASKGKLGLSLTLQHAGGGVLFAVSMLGWYIFFAQVLLSVEFPFALPLGDLSTLVSGRSIRTHGKSEV
ncbi:GPR1/FUN34/yaaH family-domain-containing protein [Emericellopsis atlantica]|uniref:GPR1/FUN34/yaaH family-domain-containing protein n=1 Tax=Emericellopsis atlantica TaxID=2614577 RepID=A0A9P7ZGQ4_9HYPO|nr:GPR1/FUN34/yaaH family-domain-containing protein [Emericellopsis atlantica]KAG9251372.1 GPR1/FUN34/yaaH family-domain-containing protein [Emericellopsis atlantica]